MSELVLNAACCSHTGELIQNCGCGGHKTARNRRQREDEDDECDCNDPDDLEDDECADQCADETENNLLTLNRSKNMAIRRKKRRAKVVNTESWPLTMNYGESGRSRSWRQFVENNQQAARPIVANAAAEVGWDNSGRSRTWMEFVANRKAEGSNADSPDDQPEWDDDEQYASPPDRRTVDSGQGSSSDVPDLDDDGALQPGAAADDGRGTADVQRSSQGFVGVEPWDDSDRSPALQAFFKSRQGG